ncbi:MAG TPA: hypothetical protein PK419_11025 [Spirochaetota bacterium]|nr:hypothetical protein [Spirochaetota bacterium]HPY03314.1 hypothetical protein [Spirochaetota bacterium]HQA53376.1 hypothetical protein [Spirochaetota bacterium]
MIKNILCLISVVFVMLFCSSVVSAKSVKIEIKPFAASNIPNSMQPLGKIILSQSWNDKNGENILIISINGPHEEKTIKITEGERYAEIYACQFIREKDQYNLLWKIKDFERHCPFDLWVGILPDSTTITDLDNDQITETTIIYKLTSRSDVSPSRMKLIMHENESKMALRGTMIVLSQNPDFDINRFEPDLSKIDLSKIKKDDQYIIKHGRYENADDFINYPKEFYEYARKQWLNFVTKDSFLQF